MYKESAEEGLIQRFKAEVAKNEPLRWRKIKQLPVSQGNAKKQNDILRMDYSWNFLEKFVPMGTQIIDRKGDMQLSPLHETMMGPSGGVNSISIVFASN